MTEERPTLTPEPPEAPETVARSSIAHISHPGASMVATETKVTATKGRDQIIAETIVDLFAMGIIGAALLLRLITAEWLQACAIAAVLLLAGVRAADLVALSRGLPSRGGPAAILFATLTAASVRLCGGSS